MEVDDARRDETAESDAEIHQHEVETESPLAMFGRHDSREQRAARPQPAPPKSASNSAATVARIRYARAPENQRRGVGDDRDHDHADRAESVGERSPNGLLPMPTSAAAESRSVAKSVEKPRTLCR